MEYFINVLSLVNGYVGLAIVIVLYVSVWYYCRISIKRSESYSDQWLALSPAQLAEGLVNETTREEKQRVVESFFSGTMRLREENRFYIHIRLKCKRYFAAYNVMRRAFSLDIPALNLQHRQDVRSSQAAICLALSKAKELGESTLVVNKANAQELADRFGGVPESWGKHLGNHTLSRYEKNERMRAKAILFLKSFSKKDPSLSFNKTIKNLE